MPQDVAGDVRLMEDLGADSLDMIELVMVIEEDFGIEIPDDDADKLLTIDQVVKYVQEKVVACNEQK